MRIMIDEKLYAHAFDILGRAGEREYREIVCEFPPVEGAQCYKLRFVLPNNSCYELDITAGSARVPNSLLAMAGFVKTQFLAISVDENGNYDIIAKSNVFHCVVGPSIEADVEPIPTYEDAQAALERIYAAFADYMVKTRILSYEEYTKLKEPDKDTAYYVINGGSLLIYLGSIPIASSSSSDLPMHYVYKHSGTMDLFGKIESEE